MACAQGSWNPPGADLSYPRTLLDSNSIDEIRATLSNPGITGLYMSVWNAANSAVPAGNTSDADRIGRAVIAREAAFVVLMNKKYENGSIVDLPAAEKDTLANKALALLNSINTKVGYQSGWVFYQEWQHRSKELIFYLTAYDLLKGAGLSGSAAHDSLVHFTGNLYYRAMATYTIIFIQLKFFEFQFDNHSIMTASALGLAAVVLNDNEDANPNYQPQNWINAGLWNLDNTLFVENGSYPRVSEPDTLAGYAEGPGYFDYAFQNAFPFIRSLYNFLPDDSISVNFKAIPRKIRNPWYDPRYYRIYDWMQKIQLPDGSEPAIHDSPIGFGTRIMALGGRPEFNLPNDNFSYDNPFIRTQYISTNVAQGIRSDSLFQVLPAAGSLVFRSSWEKDALNMHFIGKHGIALTGAKSHHQGDASSFSMMAYGQLMAVDPGYPGAPESNNVNKAKNHNCILINGGGPQPPNGEFVVTSSNTAFIEDCFSLPFFDYGEVRTSYWGDSVIRCNLFPRRHYFILNDFCSADSIRDFIFQFHGNGLEGSSPLSAEGAFVGEYGEMGGTYRRDTVSLNVRVQCDRKPMMFTTETDSLAAGYSAYRKYSKLMAHPDSTDRLSFQTVLYPYTSAIPDVTLLAQAAGYSSTVTQDGHFRDFVLTQTDTVMRNQQAVNTGMSGNISCNGQLNYVSQDASGHVVAALIRGGRRISFANRTLVSADHPLVFAWNELQPGTYEGYCGESGTVMMHGPVALRAVKGSITSVTYDSATSVNTIVFTGRGRFRLEPSNGIASPPEHTVIAITAFPNPSSDGIFTITLLSGRTTSAVISITDAGGKTVYTMSVQLKPGVNTIRADLSGNAEGEYFLTATSPSGPSAIILVRR